MGANDCEEERLTKKQMTNKKVLIANFENSNSEAEAIRQILEFFGFTVLKINIARPDDFIQILSNKLDLSFDYLILSCHGKDSKIAMPILGKDIYKEDEPRGNFGHNEIEKYLNFKNKIIISTGCTTGNNELSKAFLVNNNIYIAPENYIEGSSALPFITLLFYEITRNKNIKQAFEKAQNIDKETMNFSFFK